VLSDIDVVPFFLSRYLWLVKEHIAKLSFSGGELWHDQPAAETILPGKKKFWLWRVKTSGYAFLLSGQGGGAPPKRVCGRAYVILIALSEGDGLVLWQGAGRGGG